MASPGIAPTHNGLGPPYHLYLKNALQSDLMWGNFSDDSSLCGAKTRLATADLLVGDQSLIQETSTQRAEFLAFPEHLAGKRTKAITVSMDS